MVERRTTQVFTEIDISTGANSKRRTTQVFTEVDVSVGNTTKRRTTQVFTEVDIGFIDPYHFVSVGFS